MIKDDTEDFGKTFERMMCENRAFDLKTRVTVNDPVANGHGGGEWLGIVREFIKSKAANGETVIWGSGDILNFRRELSVKQLELLAANIAASAVNEFIDKIRRDGVK